VGSSATAKPNRCLITPLHQTSRHAPFSRYDVTGLMARGSHSHTHTPNALCSQDNIGEKMDARNREMSRFQRENKFLEKRLLELQEELTESKRIGAPPPTVICYESGRIIGIFGWEIAQSLSHE
jgi:hypothetical protein